MRFLLALSLFVVLPLATVALLLGVATSSVPNPEPGRNLDVADMERGKQIWHTLGLRQMREGQARTVVLTSRDLNLGLNYLAGRMGLTGAAAQVGRHGLEVRAAMPLPGLPVRRYLNAEVFFMPENGQLTPTRLRLGSLPLPAKLTSHVLGWALALSPMSAQYTVAMDMLRKVQLGPDRLTLTFVWRRQAMEAAMNRGAGLDEAALDAYRQKLAQTGGKELAPLLGLAMQMAAERSGSRDPVAENRAALTALAERVLGSRLGAQTSLSRMRGGGIRLAGRVDFAQHFALSAFISATGGEGLSDLAGLYKELDDARHGSGFSFNDLAADRAGSRLGEAATRSPESALRVQRTLAGVKSADIFFPRVDDLPEFMGQAEFERRYGGVGAPAYEAMVERIEARINGLKLYH